MKVFIYSFVMMVVLTFELSAAYLSLPEISGTITDINGNALPGVVVTARYEPTGRSYAVVTRADGTYRFLNMTPGGPYTLTVSMTGFITQTRNNVYAKSGQNRVFSFQLFQSTLNALY